MVWGSKKYICGIAFVWDISKAILSPDSTTSFWTTDKQVPHLASILWAPSQELESWNE